jgi:Protein of unknown function (DUF2934)
MDRHPQRSRNYSVVTVESKNEQHSRIIQEWPNVLTSFRAAGQPHGFDLDDWITAEKAFEKGDGTQDSLWKCFNAESVSTLVWQCV